MAETFETINRWQNETFPDGTLVGVIDHIREEWVEFLEAEAIDEKVEEAVDLIILLSCYIDRLTGCGAQRAVDWKMAKNRAREWNIQPDGTGRHV
jgi:hypothetical protein